MSVDSASLVVGVPKETFPGECRVAIVPATIASLKKAGCEVFIETGAGERAEFPDSEYRDQGATIAASRSEVFSKADVLLQVRAGAANPEAGREDFELLRSGQTVIAACDPLTDPQLMAELAARGVNSYSLELLPRITRAQSMDILSSMAMIAGYKAVLLAANTLPRMFPMMMTAAGTLTPAKVFIVGAGVAGLQAISAARRLGAVVQAYDIRPAVKEEVQSLGAKFLELELETNSEGQSGGYAKQMDEAFYTKQREMMTQTIAGSDVIITTAAVPGKKAPTLVTAEMMAGMKPGSVVVDIAAERGGNCELTKPGETVVENGVTILGPTNLPSEVANHASQLFSKNVSTLLLLMVSEGQFQPDFEDEIVSGTAVTQNGEVVHPMVRELLGLESKQETSEPAHEG